MRFVRTAARVARVGVALTIPVQDLLLRQIGDGHQAKRMTNRRSINFARLLIAHSC